MAFDVAQFKDIFLSEASDHLELMNKNLLLLEQNIKNNYQDKILKEPIAKSDVLLLDELMRSAHTIKSSAATMSYHKMAFFTHVLEDVFDYARNKIISLDLSAIDEIFAGLDLLSASLKSIKSNNVEIDVEANSQKIKNITGVATEGTGQSQRDKNGQPVIKQIKKNIVKTKKIAKDQESIPAQITEENISHIKVPVGRLDKLMDLTEEILIDKMRVANLIDNTIKQSQTIADISKREAMLSIKPFFDHFNLLLASLQFSVMQIRLVPVNNIFSRFPRMVRDLAKTKNKEVELLMKGEDLEVDRSIIDKLGEPLVHLLKNSIDHGIQKQGKILLEARREKDFCLIIIEDNGEGIDWSAVVEAGVRKNIISSAEANILLNKIKTKPQTEWQKEVESLLYNGRLSTKESVTETSGRGVGISVVKKFVQGIGGQIYIESINNAKKGTKFILELPLTLAITDALLVQIQDEYFAIPFASIDKVVSLKAVNIKSVGDQDIAVINGQEVPLANMKKIFKFAEDKNVPASQDKTVVLVRRGQDLAGIIVDQVQNQQQIIVKPLPQILKGAKGFSGSTILGNGKIVLIIDVLSLLQNNKDLLRV